MVELPMTKVVPDSRNGKLGDDIAATYRPVGLTCPSTCAFLGNGCYAEKGNVGIHQRKTVDDRDALEKALSSGRKILRHHVSGDFFKDDELDVEYLESLIAFHRKFDWMLGFTYTHNIRAFVEAGYTADKLPPNLIILASCDSPDMASWAERGGYRTARVAKSLDVALNERAEDEIVCPQNTRYLFNKERDKAFMKENGIGGRWSNKIRKMHNDARLERGEKPLTEISCSDCRLCFKSDRSIVFVKH